MAYRERPIPILKLGCLPAFLFGIFVGLPATLGIFVGECLDENGRVGDCPNEGSKFLLMVLVVGLLCMLITWVTNQLVGLARRRGHAAAWGVAAGFGVAAALFAALMQLNL